MSTRHTGSSATRLDDTKWGHLISRATRWRLAMDVSMSEHAVDRWDERTPVGSVSPETAYEQSVDVTMIREHIDETCDSVRYFFGCTPGDVAERETYGAVFLERDDIVFSVYNITMLDHGPSKSYLSGFNPEFAAHDRVTRGANGGVASE